MAETRAIKLGHGVDRGVLYGPVLHEGVRAVSAATSRTPSIGGRLLVGGRAPSGGAYDRGFFFEPTLIDVRGRRRSGDERGELRADRRRSPGSRRRRGARVANALPYGLAAYVYSRDLDRAWGFAERLESGAVGVNVNDTTELQAPFGGWKLSGIGRELGPEGLMAFRESKHIRIRLRGGQSS